MKRSILLVVPAVSALIAWAAGCGSNNSTFGDGDGGGVTLDGGGGGNVDGDNQFPVGETGSPVINDSGGFGACAAQTNKAEKLPLDMAIGLDTSFSMDFYNKWPSVQAALKLFVKNPAYGDLGIALQFFPIRKQCSAPDYQIPVVPMTLLPNALQAVTVALDAQQMSGGTPMVPLLEGLSAYVKAYASTQARRRPVLVLATDGFPDDTCTGGGSTSDAGSADGGAIAQGKANTLDNAIAVAAAAAHGTPPVQTFVIGVGKELSALDAIAKAGGTDSAILVDTSMGLNVEQAFLKALDNIRKRASIACEFDIPLANVNLDVNKVNVTYTPLGGLTDTLVYTLDCSKAPDNGWHFDDPSSPKQVVLCGGTCNRVKADDDGRVDVVFGCTRNDLR